MFLKSIKSKFYDKLSTGKENNLNKNSALEKICYFDKNFSTKKFLLGAKIAFQKIIQFYAKGEINKIKHVFILPAFIYLLICLLHKIFIIKKSNLNI